MTACLSVSTRSPVGTQPILRFDDLTLAYRRHPAIHHLSAQVTAGSLLAIVGPNGAGKSTLLKAIAGELRPSQGRIERCGLGRRQIAFMTQLATLDASFPINVRDFVAMGLWPQMGAFSCVDHRQHDQLDHALASVGLTGWEKHPLGTLSRGQLQRALFARISLHDATLILLDEPYAAIDAATTRDLAAVVKRWHADGRTVIAVLHDLEHVRHEYPQTLLLARELVAFGDTWRVLTSENLLRARQLVEQPGQDPAATVCHHRENKANSAP